MTPDEVRTREFALRRPAADHDQVREFLTDVADELAAVYWQLSLLDQENRRLKRALCDWQTMHARQCRPNRGRW